MKYPNLDKLISLGYTEQDLARALDLTYYELRRMKTELGHELDTVLCPEMYEEILMLGDDMKAKDAAKKWQVSEQVINMARYHHPDRRKDYNIDPADVSRLHYEGLTPREIARELKTTIKLVTSIIREHGLTRTHMTKEQLALIEQYADDGMTQQEVAEELGVSQPTIHRHWPDRLRRGSYQKRKTAEEWVEILKQARRPGANISEVAREHGVSRGSLYNKMKGK